MAKTASYNPFDYLTTEEEIRTYLDNASRDEDPRIFVIALGYLAKKRGMKATAKKVGVSRESLYKSLSGKGNPKYDTIRKVTQALGYQARVK
ncbi:addiction module antidote protein [Desulfotalea psychrophila]|uniref:Uncharacterized protein n=1 Tax=Desulfotalea psychrophila (strain LSv54 / DSM 12343) TaxID=177439 RepID=Q6ALJ0_DESPS|nr:addiction module antidote protein [Desulfotalea psychrophila]CAG36785.1 hypothetical protein DP2056 [Desulfotalea psychrophila LSv54]